MKRMRESLLGTAIALSMIAPAHAITTEAEIMARQTNVDPNDPSCTGEFFRSDGYYMVGGCGLSPANARQVLKVCRLGDQCEVLGRVENCKGINGACSRVTHIVSVRRITLATAASSLVGKWVRVHGESVDLLVIAVNDGSLSIGNNLDGEGYGCTLPIAQLTTQRTTEGNQDIVSMSGNAVCQAEENPPQKCVVYLLWTRVDQTETLVFVGWGDTETLKRKVE